MRQEVLRCQHFGCGDTEDHRAFDISFCLFRKEITGLFGLNTYEKNLLLSWLSGNNDTEKNAFRLLLRDEKFSPKTPGRVMAEGMIVIRHGISEFLSMSIRENIMILPGKPGHFFTFKKLILPDGIRKRMQEFLPGISPDEKMQNLTLGQRYIVLLLKALYFKVEIIVLDIILDGLHQKERQKLWSIINILKKEGKSFLIFLRNADLNCEYCDRVYVFHHGNGVRAFEKKDVRVEKIIFCLMNAGLNPKHREKAQKHRFGEVFLKVNKMVLSGENSSYSFVLKKGTVTGFIDFEQYHFLKIADALFGLCNHQEEVLEIEGVPCQLQSPVTAWKKKIFLMHSPNDLDHSFYMMDFKENLMLPWVKTSSYPGGILREKFIQKEYDNFIEAEKTLSSKFGGSNKEKLYLLFYQIKLLNIKLLILKNPTKGLNYQDTEFVHYQIRKMAESGKSIALITSDIGEINACCDECYYIEGGKVCEHKYL